MAQDRPRAVGPRLALDRGVAGEPADLRLPRQPGEAADVGHRDQVGVVGRLADVAGGEAGEPGPVAEQAVELLRRDQLRARLRVHVDELGEEELDPVVGDRSPDVLGGRARRHALVVSHIRADPGNGAGASILRPRMWARHIVGPTGRPVRGLAAAAAPSCLFVPICLVCALTAGSRPAQCRSCSPVPTAASARSPTSPTAARSFRGRRRKPSERELNTYNYFRRNVAGVQREWWYHRSGCRAWFHAERDTTTNEVQLGRPPASDEPPPPSPGERIDRGSDASRFSFDGKPVEAFEGDTIGSALHASGRRVLSRSFKYHRPRGPLLLRRPMPQLPRRGGRLAGRPRLHRAGPRRDAGRSHEREPVAATSTSCAATDVVGKRLTPPGFYYKTFIRPRRLWPLYEKVLRHAAGLGRLPRRQAEREWRTEYRRRHADVLVIGGGVAGMAAALRAAELGADVVLVDDGPELGGALLAGDGASARARARRPRSRGRGRGARPGGGARVLRRDRPGLVREHPAPGARRPPRRRHRLDRAAADVRGQRPSGGDALLGRPAAGLPLRGPARARPRSSRPPATRASRRRSRSPRRGSRSPRSPTRGRGGPGAELAATSRAGRDPAAARAAAWSARSAAGRSAGRCSPSSTTPGAGSPAREQRTRLRSDRRLRRDRCPRPRCCCRPGRRRAGTRPRGAYLPDAPPPGIQAAGAVAGHGIGCRRRDLGLRRRGRGGALARARRRGRRRAPGAPSARRSPPASPRPRRSPAAASGRRAGRGKCFACLCEDVTTDDLDFAIDEGFDSLELAKRYTTVTMGPCQGRMCQLASIRQVSARHPDAGRRRRADDREAAVVDGADGGARRAAVRAGEALGGARPPPRARRQRALGGRLAAALRLRRSAGGDDGRARRAPG